MWCSFSDACWIYSFFLCWIPLGSSTWIPYFLLALPAMNICTMEWRSFLGVSWVFTLSRSRCFSIELKQDNQATIHQGSSTWIPYFGLATNTVRRFLWCSGSVCSRLLSFFFFNQVFISNELKQVNQAMIFHGSWTWSFHSNLLHLEQIVLFGL